MREKITEALAADKVDITDTYGDGRHVSIDVVSKAFEGESSMKRCVTVVVHQEQLTCTCQSPHTGGQSPF